MLVSFGLFFKFLESGVATTTLSAALYEWVNRIWKFLKKTHFPFFTVIQNCKQHNLYIFFCQSSTVNIFGQTNWFRFFGVSNCFSLLSHFINIPWVLFIEAKMLLWHRYFALVYLRNHCCDVLSLREVICNDIEWPLQWDCETAHFCHDCYKCVAYNLCFLYDRVRSNVEGNFLRLILLIVILWL